MSMFKKFWENKLLRFGTIGAVAVAAIGGGYAIYAKPKVEEKTATVSMQQVYTPIELSGDVAANETRQVYSQVQAKVREILVNEGDYVKKGQKLVLLDTTEQEYAIKQAELNVDGAKKNESNSVSGTQLTNSYLKKSLDNRTDSQIMAADKAKKDAEDALDVANTTLEAAEAKAATDGPKEKAALDEKDIKDARVADLKTDPTDTAKIAALVSENSAYESKVSAVSLSSASQLLYSLRKDAFNNWNNATDDETKLNKWDVFVAADKNLDDALAKELKSEADLDAAKAAVKSAEDALEAAKKQVKLAEDSVKEQIDKNNNSISTSLNNNNVKSSELTLEKEQENLDKYTIVAPCDGYVTSLNCRVGDLPDTANPMLKVYNYETETVTIDVDEYDMKEFQLGTKVNVSVSSQDGFYEGEVIQVASEATKNNDMSYIKVTVEFKPDKMISSGLSATVSTVPPADAMALAVPSEAINLDMETFESFVYKQENGAKVKTVVTVGSSNGMVTAILTGLEDGDVVVYEGK